MGGDYYDRDVQPVASSSQSYSVAYSEEASNLGQNKEVHSSLNPIRWIDETLQCDAQNPIVFALDVTGSMGEWAKIIYDKMPMFYGQIMMQGYLKDPAISFCAIGDHKAEDDIPIQVSEFGQGKGIDQIISKMVLWKSGGGNEHESYELGAYFYETSVDLLNVELPFFFITGDEGYWDTIEGSVVQKIFGKGAKHASIASSDIWLSLMQKYNVFHIHKPYTSANYEAKIHKQWIDILGQERVLDIVTPKACVDLILGAIALTSGRKLDQYITDMKNRGQDNTRITEVTNSLKKYSERLANGSITPVTFKSSSSGISVVDTDFTKNNTMINNAKPNNSDEFSKVMELFEQTIIEDFDDDSKKYRENLQEMKMSKGDLIPKEFICPITNEIIINPVMTCDGFTYERKAIEIWLEKHNNESPVTGEKLNSVNLMPNFLLKGMIRDYYFSHLNN